MQRTARPPYPSSPTNLSRFRPPSRSTGFLPLTLVLWLVTLVGSAGLALATPPPGFQNQLVHSFEGLPMAIVFLPDGQALVPEKEGTIHLLDPTDGSVAPNPVLVLTNLATEFERGLLDLTLDPDFATNGHLYLYYSAAVPARFRVSRFTYDFQNETADPASEFVVWQDHADHVACCHYGGSLDFGPDGLIYVSMGDEFAGFPAEDLSDTAGSVLRFAPDGSIPADNPFLDEPGARPEIWLRGFRNPFRARWDLPTGRLFIGDVGGNDQETAHEELNLATTASGGQHYGWPWCEGPSANPDFPNCDPALHTDPVFSYPHAGFGAAIVAGGVYRGTVFPVEYQGAFFYGDYTRRFIRYLTFDSSGLVVTGDFDFEPVTNFMTSIVVGPDGALYYTELNGGLRRILYIDQAPRLECSASTTLGTPPLTVTFSCVAEDDQDATVALHFDFGDGTFYDDLAIPVGTPVIFQQTYTTKGQVTAFGTATDVAANTGTSEPLTLGVGQAPDLVIFRPLGGSLFRAGDLVECEVLVSDPDGTVDPATIRWSAEFIHNEHTHPGPTQTGGTLFSFEIPGDQHDFRDQTGYRIYVEATDDDGLVGSDTISIFPDKIDLTLATDPPGLTLAVDGLPTSAPAVFDTLIGFGHLVTAADQCFVGTRYRFEGWSDGAPASHLIIVPETDLTLTATFSAQGSCIPLAGRVLHLDAADGVMLTQDGSVSTWLDGSPSANHLAPLVEGPTWVAGLLGAEPGGQPYLSFDGVDDALAGDGFTDLPLGNADRSMFWAVRYHGDGPGGLTYGQPIANQTFGLTVSPGDGKLTIQGWGPTNDFKSTADGEGTGWLSQGVVLEAGQLTHLRDGEVVDSRSHVWDTAGDRLRLGAEIDDEPHIALDVAEILIYDRALDPTELQLIETYLRQKYFPLTPQPPAAHDDFAVVTPGGGVVIDVLANDHDPDGDGHLHGDDLVVTDPDPLLGSVVVDPATGELTFTTATGVEGTAVSFGYTITDHQGLPGSATVTVRVLEDEGPPLDGLALYLRADTGTVSDAEGTVLAWHDLVASRQLAALGNPTIEMGPLGDPYLDLDGFGDHLELDPVEGLPAAASDRSVFAVVRYREPAFGGIAWGSPGTDCAVDGNRVFGLVSDHGGQLTVQGWCPQNDFPSAAPALGGWRVHGAVLSADHLLHTDNGQRIAEHDHGFDTDPLGRLVIGAEIDGDPHLAMDVAALLIYDRALDEDERHRVENHLRRLWIGDTTPPTAEDDLAVVLAGSTSTVEVLANDTDGGLLDPASLVVEQTAPGVVALPTAEGAIDCAVDPATLPGTQLEILYTVADGLGNRSLPATLTLVVADASLPTAGLVLRLESTLGVSTDAQGAVTSWLDLTGSGNTLDPPMAPSAPQLMAGGPRGFGYLSFDGLDDRLERTLANGLPAGASDRSVFLLVRYHEAGFGGFGWGSPGSDCAVDGNRVFALAVDGPGRLAIQGWCPENDFPSPVFGTQTGWLSQSVVLTADSLAHYRGGFAIDQRSHAFATDGAGRLVLGAEIDGDPNLAMDVAAVLVYDRALDTTQRHAVETYLHGKYLATDFVNPPPVVADDQALVTPLGCVDVEVLANDGDDSALATESLMVVPGSLSGGTAAPNPDGSVHFCSDASTLRGGFAYTVADDAGAVSAVASVVVMIDDPPPVTTGLVLHLETPYGAIVSDALGVVGWLDRSPAANDLVAVGEPERVAGELAPWDVLRFGATGGRLQNASPLVGLPGANDDRTVFTVVRYRGAGFGGIAWGTPVCNRVFGLVVDNHGDLTVQGWCSDFRSTTPGMGGPWLLHGATLEAGTLTQRRDGVLIHTASHVFDTHENGQLVIGAEIDGSPAVDMDVAAVLVYDRALSATERQAVEAHLVGRYLP